MDVSTCVVARFGGEGGTVIFAGSFVGCGSFIEPVPPNVTTRFLTLPGTPRTEGSGDDIPGASDGAGVMRDSDRMRSRASAI